jgi:thiamine kinase-like enzyme
MAKVHSQATYKLAVEKYGFDKAQSIYGTIKELSAYDWSGAVLVDEETTKWFNSKIQPLEQRKSECSMVADKIETVDLPTTFCHMDSNPTNLIYIEEEGRSRRNGPECRA